MTFVGSKFLFSTPASARLQSAPLVWLTGAGVVLMLAIAVGTALTVARFRQNAIEYGEDNLQSAVRLLARHFDQQFQDFSVLQKSIVTELEQNGLESPDIFKSAMATLSIHETLRSKASGWTDIAGANLFDANGILINSSHRWPVADVSIADRAYFRRLKNGPSSGEEIEVVPGRFGGGHAIVFARRISGPHGEFLGAVTRAMAPEVLATFFSSAGLGDGSSISMHHRNGQLIARYPHIEGVIGKNFREGPAQQVAVFNQETVITRLTSPMDSKDRLLASRMLMSEPLVIVATKTVESALVTWQSQTKFFVAVAAASILILVLTLYLIFRRMTWQLSLDKKRLDTAMDTMTQGLLMFDHDGRLVVCNRRYIEMYNLSSEIVKPGAALRDIVRHRQQTGSFLGDVDAYCDDVMRSAESSRTKVIASGGGRLIEVKIQSNNGGGWLALHEDVTERIRTEKQISHLAHHDALTDLPNRVLMRKRVEQLAAELTHNAGFAVFYIDLDGFKAVNDTLGHEAGDEVLCQVSNYLQKQIQQGDIIARLGGDEFAVVKAGVQDPAALAEFADQILRGLREAVSCRGQHIPTAASIGIAIAPTDGRDLDDLLRRSDLAMYAAKADECHPVRFFNQDLETKAIQRREIETDLSRALENNELEVHYQPSVSLVTGAIAGCEALFRWHHPTRGMVSPAEFIPVAEETGLIGDIGEWVLKQACNEACGWPTQISVAVNVSPLQFRSNTFPIMVAAALRQSGLSPSRLELEITETVLIRDYEGALVILNQLRDLGVRIALDDFGTGYSSLSYLHRLPLSKVKIDRSFVSDLDQTHDSSAIVKAVIDMASARGMATTAEGVETQTQRDALQKLGCQEMQGYLFSPAVEPAKLKQLMLAPPERTIAA